MFMFNLSLVIFDSWENIGEIVSKKIKNLFEHNDM